MNLYVISKFKDFDIIKFNTILVKEETNDAYYTFDKIEILDNKCCVKKEEIDKENKYYFITRDRRKIKKQAKRIYNNINDDLYNQIGELQYKLQQLQEFKNRNDINYKQIIK